ncbi:hypothetical protein CLOP_g18218 [Closterium sp. NIES-67]|nr:hypothetical protein CLOP_g18218 [Closterium sp. NIES-67]
MPNTAGVFVAFAAGNSGRPSGTSGFNTYRTISNFSPFYLTVGASSIQRGGASLVRRATRKAASTTAAASTAANNSRTTQSATAAVVPATTKPTSSAKSNPQPHLQTRSIRRPTVAISSSGPLVRPWTGVPGRGGHQRHPQADIIGPGVALFSAWVWFRRGQQRELCAAVGDVDGNASPGGHCCSHHAEVPLVEPGAGHVPIMTTAITTNTAGTAIKNAYGSVATPWEIGAGHVYVPKVLDPGLTMTQGKPITGIFLAGMSTALAQQEFPGAQLSPIAPRNLNRATVSVARLRGSVMVKRTVTNVAGSASTYTAKITAPPGVSVIVNPKSFSIQPGAKATYRLRLTVTRVFDSFQFGDYLDGWQGALGKVSACCSTIKLCHREGYECNQASTIIIVCIKPGSCQTCLVIMLV